MQRAAVPTRRQWRAALCNVSTHFNYFLNPVYVSLSLPIPPDCVCTRKVNPSRPATCNPNRLFPGATGLNNRASRAFIAVLHTITPFAGQPRVGPFPFLLPYQKVSSLHPKPSAPVLLPWLRLLGRYQFVPAHIGSVPPALYCALG